MQLIFLGTSSGSPTQERNVAAVALRYRGGWDLFDCGEGTQHRLLPTPLSLPKLRRVFISHLHGDHCFGLFGLLCSRSMAGAKTPLDVYGPAGLEEMVNVVLTTSDSHLVFPIRFHVVAEQGSRVIETDDEIVDAIALDHRVTSFAWHIQESDRPGVFDAAKAIELGLKAGPAFSRLQRGESIGLPNGSVVHPCDVLGPARAGRSLIISGDNRDPARLLAASGPVQLLVHESTYTDEVVEHLGQDQGHSTAARVGDAAQAAAVPHVVLTHFSPRFGPPGCAAQSIDEIRDEATRHYQGDLHLAEDYAVYELTVDGALRSQPTVGPEA